MELLGHDIETKDAIYLIKQVVIEVLMNKDSDEYYECVSDIFDQCIQLARITNNKDLQDVAVVFDLILNLMDESEEETDGKFYYN
jgi:hypothetical protein